MSRRLAVASAALLVSGLALAPAHAATHKKITTTYTLTLTPDPTQEATGLVGDGCHAVIPTAQDDHAFKVPAAGTLDVTLDAPDPAGSGETDWDLWTRDADGSILSGSNSGGNHEETVDTFKRATRITIEVCNLAGAPQGRVKAVFTYRR